MLIRKFITLAMLSCSNSAINQALKGDSQKPKESLATVSGSNLISLCIEFCQLLGRNSFLLISSNCNTRFAVEFRPARFITSSVIYDSFWDIDIITCHAGLFAVVFHFIPKQYFSFFHRKTYLPISAPIYQVCNNLD